MVLIVAANTSFDRYIIRAMSADMNIIPNFQMKTTLLLAWLTLNLLELAIFRGRTRSEAVPIGSGTLGAQDGAETSGGHCAIKIEIASLQYRILFGTLTLTGRIKQLILGIP